MRRGGRPFRCEDSCRGIWSRNCVLDDVTFTVDIERSERAGRIGVYGELIVMLAVEGVRTRAFVYGAGALQRVAVQVERKGVRA